MRFLRRSLCRLSSFGVSGDRVCSVKQGLRSKLLTFFAVFKDPGTQSDAALTLNCREGTLRARISEAGKSTTHRACGPNSLIPGRDVHAALQAWLPSDGWSTADYAGRAADATLQLDHPVASVIQTKTRRSGLHRLHQNYSTRSFCPACSLVMGQFEIERVW